MQAREKRRFKRRAFGASYSVFLILFLVASYQFVDPMRYEINQFVGICEVKFKDTPARAREFYKVPLDVYVLNSPTYPVSWSDEEIHAMVEGASAIWKQYGIEFLVLRAINRSIAALADEDVLIGISGNQTRDVTMLGKKVLGDMIYDANSNVIKVFYVRSFYNRTVYLVDILGIKLIHLGENIAGGIGLNGQGISAAFVGYDKNMSWALAHELGHVLNNKDISEYSGRYNLMNHSGCIKERYHPTVLNEEQYENVLKKIGSIRHN